MSFLKGAHGLLALNLTTLLGVGGSTYLLRSHMIELSEDHEARMGMFWQSLTELRRWTWISTEIYQMNWRVHSVAILG